MKTMTKWQLPLLAVATLLVAACDPFPSAPGGSPKLVRVVASGTDLVIVGAGGDETLGLGPAAVADPSNVTVPGVSGDSIIFIQFNKPLDGSTIQASPDVDSSGNPIAGSCTPAANLTMSATWPAGTAVCYYPASPDDGAQIYIEPAAVMATGDYTISGTIKDYEGKSITIGVTFQVP
jgi:hypothetical protein